jgi:hypothetical protein
MKPIDQLLSRGGAQSSPASSGRAFSNRFLSGFVALSAGLVLTACGGGGGGGSSAPSGGTGSTTPTQPTTPTNPVASAKLTASAASVTAGQPVTLTWISADTGAANCTASGDWTGTKATSGSEAVTTKAATSAYTATYTLTCGSATSSATVSVTPPAVSNTVQMTLDTGPDGSDKNAINIPYVSVTVCKPGTTQCQTIDHIMVDTGSFGLRIVAPLNASLGLQPLTTASGATVGECGQFVSGYTWGSVLKADVKVGSEVASNQSIQVVDGAAAIGAAPDACTAKGGTLGTVKALGANGVLGIGLFKQDCGSACVNSAAPAAYYACTGGVCTSTTMPLAQQVSNPIAAFAVNNNGVIISYPAVNTGGGAPPAGTLTFGIGTQSNNGLGSTTKYAVNNNGNFTTVYKGVTMADSFLDTGSNGLFFTDSTLPKCSFNTDFYCPASPLSLSATVSSPDGSASSTINFKVESVDNLPNGAASGWIAGPGTGSKAATSFDWGLPFFFGRKVYIGMEGTNVAPYWAF